MPDLENVIYDVRTIELSCFITANSAAALIDAYNNFTKMLNVKGVKTLQVVVGSKPLSFQAYFSEVSNIEKKFRDGQMHGTFTLKFIEPDTSIYES